MRATQRGAPRRAPSQLRDGRLDRMAALQCLSAPPGGQNIRFLIGIFILQKTRQRFWLSSAIAGQPDVAAAFGLRV